MTVVVLLLLVLGIVGVVVLIMVRRKGQKLHRTGATDVVLSAFDNPISKLHHHVCSTHRMYTLHVENDGISPSWNLSLG